ncbi:MAG TPA: hypothetical protein PLY40_06670 [Bacillota bacterium]|nr:hypothetical protein [Bacillota bacterium]
MSGILRKAIWIVLLASVLGAAGCAAPQGEAGEREPDLRVAVTMGPEALPLLAAFEGGYFEDVLVEPVPVAGRGEALVLFQSGAVDGGTGGLFTVAGLQGMGFLVFATSTSGADYILVTGPAEGEEGRPGPAVALREDQDELYLLEALLEKLEAEPAEREYHFTRDSAQALEALRLGHAGAAFLPRPAAEYTLPERAAISGSTLEHDLPGGIIFFSGEALQEKEPQIRAFYQGCRAAVQALNDGEPAVLAPLVEKWGFPEAWREGLPFSLPGPRALTLDEAAAALAWLAAREPDAAIPASESLIWRSDLWE